MEPVISNSLTFSSLFPCDDRETGEIFERAAMKLGSECSKLERLAAESTGTRNFVPRQIRFFKADFLTS